MKYGDTLRQHSIPEWGHYNIDYDYLKELIKHQTTPGAGRALAIPGHGDATENSFGNSFFQVLKAQHDRINLFVKSKSGEIERRLQHIERSLKQLQAHTTMHMLGSRLPAKIVEKYAKIDADLSKTGEEIRSLSRFRVAQRTGFFKILKKYKRWTRDSELEHRFKEEISGNPGSFFQLDLGHLLDQYIDVLGALRTPFDELNTSGASEIAKAQTSASRISKALHEGTEVDFDFVFYTIPLGSRGSRATYWIHPDQVVEVEVLLLQHMRTYTSPNSKTTSSSANTPFTTPAHRKSSATTDHYFGNEDPVGLIVLDDPRSFAMKQNAGTIGSKEEATGIRPAIAAGSVQWTSSSEAIVAVGLQSNQDIPLSEHITSAKLKRKHIETFLSSTEPINDLTHDLAVIRKWLTDHESIKPIAGVCSKRTRFIGIQNTPNGGMWATLDRDIFMKSSLHADLKDNEWLFQARNDSLGFPHAVLEVRRENSQSAGLIRALDNSHLVERVRGFSLEAHVVWACCKPSVMSAPFWVPLLNKDIRKLPAPAGRQRRKAGSTTNSFSRTPPSVKSPSTVVSVTDGQTSPLTARAGESSATSAPELEEPPMLHAFRKKYRIPCSKDRRPIQVEAPPERQRYWNEYDNPESEDDGYYIYIDPNETVKFPGQELIEEWVRKTRKFLGIRIDHEGSTASPTLEYVSSDEETADESTNPMAGNYGAIQHRRRLSSREGYFSSLFRALRDPHRDAQIRRQSEHERQALLNAIQMREHDREMTKLRFYTTCLASAVVIDIILSIMIATSRRKVRGVVDCAILFGSICNLMLLVVAVLSMRTRHDKLGWLHQGFVLLICSGLIAVDVLLLRWVLNP